MSIDGAELSVHACSPARTAELRRIFPAAPPVAPLLVVCVVQHASTELCLYTPDSEAEKERLFERVRPKFVRHAHRPWGRLTATALACGSSMVGAVRCGSV